MPLMAFVNDKMTPLQDAVVPVLDRGFLFGDSLFEVMKVWSGRPVHAQEHVERLIVAASRMGFQGLPQPEVFLDRVGRLIQASGLDIGYVYIQVSRGVAPCRSRVSPLRSPTVVIFVDDSQGPAPEQVENGVSVITVPDDRALFGEFKTTSAMPRIMAEMRATDQGAYEALYRDRDGRVYEATAANLFIVKCSLLLTPLLDRHVLPGVTREKVIELTRDLGLEVRQRHITYDEVIEADEVFLTGSVKLILGVVDVDGHRIGNGRSGPITIRLRNEYVRRYFQ